MDKRDCPCGGEWPRNKDGYHHGPNGLTRCLLLDDGCQGCKDKDAIIKMLAENLEEAWSAFCDENCQSTEHEQACLLWERIVKGLV